MEQNWIKVYTTANFYQAEIIKQMLELHHIEAVLLNRQDSVQKTFGDIEVYIHQQDFGEAIGVLIAGQLDTSDT